MLDVNLDAIEVKDYKYCLTWKFPFIKKRKLTQLEMLHKKMEITFEIIPIAVMILGTAKFIKWVKEKVN